MIVADFLWRAFGDLFAVIEHGYPVAGVHDDLQDMLDDDHGQAEALFQRHHDPHDVVDIDRRQAGRGFIQKEEFRPHCDRPIQRQQPPLTDRHFRRRNMCKIRQPDQFQDVHHFVHDALLFRGNMSCAEEARESAVPNMAMVTDPQIVEHTHLGEHPEQLEGARHAGFRDPVRLPVSDVIAVKDDRACVYRVDSAQQVEECAFAGSVRTDDGAHFPLFKLEIHVLDRVETAKMLVQPCDLQQCVHQPSPSGRASTRSRFWAAVALRAATNRRETKYRSMMPPMPFGMKMTVPTITRPKSSSW